MQAKGWRTDEGVCVGGEGEGGVGGGGSSRMGSEDGGAETIIAIDVGLQ
jgi:hypothetical protein